MDSVFELTKQNVKTIKKKSTLRRYLLAKTLGLNKPNEPVSSILNLEEKLNRSLIKKSREVMKEHNRKLNAECNVLRENEVNSFVDDKCELIDDDMSVKEENEGPKNDYNQYFVDIGHRPQNFIRDPGLNERFEEYPKLRELIKLKDDLISKTNVPKIPMYLKCPLINGDNTDFNLLKVIGCEFDVILIDPPLHEYQNGVHYQKCFSWDEIRSIDVGSVAAQRSFIFLWCGSADGLDKGRECFKKWGFRRCEDICWIKTNKKSPEHNRNLEPGAIFQRTKEAQIKKEHCLMGIKGTVRRSLDSNFIHTNIDIDLIITEEPEYGCEKKPEEIFHIIEHFCLGKRRLYLFGRDNTIRQGWLTVGPELSDSNFDKTKFKQCFEQVPNGNLTGSSERIELLRPKTPPLKTKQIAISNQLPMQANPIINPLAINSSEPVQNDLVNFMMKL